MLLVMLTLILAMKPRVEAQILIGPKIGYQMSWIRYAKLYDGPEYAEGLSFSPQLGALYSFSVSKQLSFYSELYYSHKGKQERTADETTLMRMHRSRYHFLEVPMMLRVTHRFKDKKQSPSVYFNAGPHVAFWLFGTGRLQSMETFGSTNRLTTDYSIGFTPSDDQDDVLFAEDANRFQFGLNAGTGMIIPVNNQGHILQIDFRYMYSSSFMGSNLNQEIGNTAVEENFSFGHSMASVSVAYAFFVDVWGLRKGKSLRRR